MKLLKSVFGMVLLLATVSANAETVDWTPVLNNLKHECSDNIYKFVYANEYELNIPNSYKNKIINEHYKVTDDGYISILKLKDSIAFGSTLYQIDLLQSRLNLEVRLHFEDTNFMSSKNLFSRSMSNFNIVSHPNPKKFYFTPSVVTSNEAYSLLDSGNEDATNKIPVVTDPTHISITAGVEDYNKLEFNEANRTITCKFTDSGT